MNQSESIEAWLAIHRQLMDQEAAFTQLAVRAARGDIDLHELDRERAELMAMRERCTAAYARAFPRAGAAS